MAPTYYFGLSIIYSFSKTNKKVKLNKRGKFFNFKKILLIAFLETISHYDSLPLPHISSPCLFRCHQALGNPIKAVLCLEGCAVGSPALPTFLELEARQD